MSFSNHVVNNAHTPEKGFPTMTSADTFTDRTPTGPAPDPSPSRDDPGTTRCRSAGGATPRSGDSCTAAPPAARPRSAAATRTGPAVTVPAARPRREITVYECPDCGDRYLGEQRCESCGTFARRVGIGGACPNCEGPVAISDLLDEAVVTITKESPTPRVATAKAKHGLPFAQYRRSVPRADRHEMETRDADGRGELQAGRGQHLAVRGRVLPARCSPRGVVCCPSLKFGTGVFPSEGVDPGAGFVTPSPISCHDMRQGQPARADLWTNPPRRRNRHRSLHPPRLRTSSPGPAGTEPAIRPHLTPPPTGAGLRPKNPRVGPNQTSTVGPDGVVILIWFCQLEMAPRRRFDLAPGIGGIPRGAREW